MACDFISKGLKVSQLANQMGGINNIYIAQYDNYNFETIQGELTDLGTLATVYKYEFNAKTESLSEDLVIDRDTMNATNTQTLAGSFPRLKANLQHELSLLVRNRTFIFVEDRNGNIQLMGAEHGVFGTSLKKQTGAAQTDMSGYTAEFSAVERELSPFLGDAAKTALLAAVDTDYLTQC